MISKLTIIWMILMANIASSQTITISYSDLSDAYRKYDTVFFNNLKGKTVDILYRGRYLRRDRIGDGFVPMLDWYLNKKGAVSEWDFNRSNDTMDLIVYNMKDDCSLNIKIKITGSKPRVYFKKGRRNWFVPKKTEDCEIIQQDFIKTEYDKSVRAI